MEQQPCVPAQAVSRDYNRGTGMSWLPEKAEYGGLQIRPRALDQTCCPIRIGPKELPRWRSSQR